MAEEGVLEQDKQGKLSRNVRLPGLGQTRCYVLRFGGDVGFDGVASGESDEAEEDES